MNKGRFYIRKVTQHLTDELNKLGYEDCWTGYIHSQEVKDIILVFDGKWTLSGFIPYPGDGFYDCGTDEEFFLALARYDDIYDEEPVGEWQNSLKKLWRKVIKKSLNFFKTLLYIYKHKKHKPQDHEPIGQR